MAAMRTTVDAEKLGRMPMIDVYANTQADIAAVARAVPSAGA